MAIVINGSGTVTGLAVGGLPDGTVDSDTLASGIDKTSISDSGDATAITIDSNERVTVNSGELVVSNNASWGGEVAGKIEQLNNTLYIQGGSGSTSHIFRNSSGTNTLDLTNDGRGLSQFTAKAWVNFNGSGTVAIQDSHNVSSITDHEMGSYSVNFANDMANANFSSTLTAGNWETTNIDSYMACGLYDTASGQTVSKQKFRTIRLNMSSVMFKDPKTVCGTFFGD